VRLDLNATNIITIRGGAASYSGQNSGQHKVTVGIVEGDMVDEIHIAVFNAVMRLWVKNGTPCPVEGQRTRPELGAPVSTQNAATNYWRRHGVTMSSTLPDVMG
jgi:hypothetical protein